MATASNTGVGIRISAAVAVVALVVATAVVFVHLRDDAATGRAELVATRHELAATRSTLHAATIARDRANAALALSRHILEQDRARRDLSYTELVAQHKELLRNQQQLAEATNDLQQRTARLGHLNVCLAGAAKALNQAAVADINGLSRTLMSISADCTAAKGGA